MGDYFYKHSQNYNSQDAPILFFVIPSVRFDEQAFACVCVCVCVCVEINIRMFKYLFLNKIYRPTPCSKKD